MSEQLPNLWSLRSSGDLFEFVTSGSRGWAQYYVDNGPLFVRIGNLDHDTISLDLRERQHVKPPANSEGERTRLRAGDILISITAELGMVGLVPDDLGEAYINQHIALARPREGLDARYLAWFFASAGKRQLLDMRRGMTKAGLGLDDIRAVSVGIPPLSEQRRIVAKLEALHTRSRRAREALDAVPRLLEKLRQSILASAFRGDLTKDWRAKNKDVEPASELLKRIRTERRKKWEEAELAKMKAKGKTPTDDKWKAKYKEPEPVDVTGLPELPERWCWASVEDVALVGGGLTKNASKRTGGTDVPLISVASVQLRRIDVDEVSSIRLADEDGDKGELCPGDLLVVEGNGSLSHIGRVAIWNGEIPGARHQNHLIRVRPVLVSPEYTLEWLASPLGRRSIIAQATSAAGLYTLSLSKVDALPIPVAPAPEQAVLIAAVQDAVSHVTTLLGAARSVSTDLSTLGRAILAKAFRGELVPQDPNDEPAEAMLERVRAPDGAHAHVSKSKPKGGRPTKSVRPEAGLPVDE